MKWRFIYLFVFFSAKVFCQDKVSAAEYKVYDDVLKQIFIEKGFEVENFTKPHTALNFGKLTLSNAIKVSKESSKEMLSDTFYANFKQLNEKQYKLNAKKIKVKVASKYKQFSINLSRCYIEKDYAIVFVGIVFAPLNGTGNAYIVKYDKTTNSWKIVDVIRGWIS